MKKNKDEEIQKRETIKPAKRKLNKVEITGIVAAAFVVVAIIIGITVAVFTNTNLQTSKAQTQSALGNYLIFKLMPKELEGEVDGEKIVFHVRQNPEYDKKKDVHQPLNYFDYYYIDKDGNEVDLGSDGIFHGKPIEEGGDGDQAINYAFYIKAAEQAQTVKKHISIIITVVVIVLIVVLIGVWFILWSRHEDAEKERLYKNNQKHNKKKK